MKRKILALLLSLAMLLSIGGMVEGTLAVGISVDSTRSSVTLGEVDPVPTPTPEATVEPTPEATPETTPDATPAPDTTPAPEDEGEATPTPEASPETTPVAENDLYDRLMACTTQEALEDLIAETPEEYFGLLSDEQIQKVEAHIKSLETVPLPAVTIENDVIEETVPSEIVRPTVNYTYVAPFGDPVTGGNN